MRKNETYFTLDLNLTGVYFKCFDVGTLISNKVNEEEIKRQRYTDIESVRG